MKNLRLIIAAIVAVGVTFGRDNAPFWDDEVAQESDLGDGGADVDIDREGRERLIERRNQHDEHGWRLWGAWNGMARPKLTGEHPLTTVCSESNETHPHGH